MDMIVAGCRVSDKLYESAHSLVYRAVRIEDQCPVVLKILQGEYPSPEDLAGYRQEYALLRTMEGNGTIQVYALQPYQQSLVIVTEDFGGEALRRWLPGSPDPGNLFPATGGTVAGFLEIALKITECLNHIHHQHIIHKDLNPSNILLNLETGVVKIIDFGISSWLPLDASTLNSSSAMQGTLIYISPEQTGRMNRTVDYRSDFYSLGVTFYELLVGKPPFEMTDPLGLIHAHIAQLPMPPHLRQPLVPEALSQIVMKLLSKDAEMRYQSAWGLRADLLECQRQLAETGQMEPFSLGRADVVDTLRLPQKLYGRDTEIAMLQAAFSRIGEEGKELFLISGAAGVGKSVLVDEVHRPISERQGTFIAGKFDLLQRRTPYYALRQAFEAFCDELLASSSEELEEWKARIMRAVGTNGRLLTDIIPNLELVIGPQPGVAELGGQENANRFIMVFQQFIQAVSLPEHPLVLFLDDLQWADSASLRLLEAILGAFYTRYLLIIGVYRSEDVDPAHPLTALMEHVLDAGVTVTTVELGDLSREEVDLLLGDALRCPVEAVRSLGHLIYAKTDGNPFFLIEFLKTLVAEGWLRFNYDPALSEAAENGCHWWWDAQQIQAQTITDNVVTLLQGKIGQLPDPTRKVLRLAACIGSYFDLETLSMINRPAGPETLGALWPAIEVGLIVPLNDRYRLARVNTAVEFSEVKFRFQHDRVQQAVVALMSEADLQEIHLRLGRLLLMRKQAEGIGDEDIFILVSHLNYGLDLITGERELLELADLNRRAGRRAYSGTAFEGALGYLQTAARCLQVTSWQENYALLLDLYTAIAEAAYADGDFVRADGAIAEVLTHAANLLDKIRVYEIQLRLLRVRNELQRAVTRGLEILRELGEPFPTRFYSWHTVLAFGQVGLMLGRRKPEALVALPVMEDPYKQAAMRMIAVLSSVAYLTASDLLPLLILRQVTLSLRYGNHPFSIIGYVSFGLILTVGFGQVDLGHRFAEVALRLLDSLKADFLRAQTYVLYTTLYHWKKPLRDTLPLLMEGYQSGLESGDLEYLSYAISLYLSTSFLVGENLEELAEAYEVYNPVISQLKQQTILETNHLYQQSVLNLLVPNVTPSRLTGPIYEIGPRLEDYARVNNSNALFSIHLDRLILGYWFNDLEQALDAHKWGMHYSGAAFGTMSIPLIHFYGALSLLAYYPKAPAEEWGGILKTVRAYHKKLVRWAKGAPMNYQHKADLVEAELCRVLKKEAAARVLYDRAIAGARRQEFINEEALAGELAGRFYLSLDQAALGYFYLRNARYAYQRWGARSKVQLLEDQYPELMARSESVLSQKEGAYATTPGGKFSDKLLDMSTMMKFAQAISGEIVLEQLQNRLMQIAMENAGAQMAFLLQPQDNEWWIVAQALGTEADEENGGVHLEHEPLSEQRLPLSVINYVRRTQSLVVLHHAVKEGAFRRDPYIVARQLQSLVCLPLLNQGRTVGILYMENNLMPGAFPPERLEVFQLLAAQSAIALENAQLYGRMEDLVAERTMALLQANSALQQYTHELESSNAELDAFAHTVAHDLKNPLTSLLGYSYVLETRLDASMVPGILLNAVQAIKRSGIKMTSIINELLLLASVRKMGDVALEPLAMGPIVNEALGRLQEIIAESHAEVVLPESWPVGLGYGPWVEEVWANYISNAIKYGGRPDEGIPPRLEVGGDFPTDRPGYVRFWVQDNGMGLTLENQKKLFAQFSRLEQARAEGHGLGLSIVQRIVARLGGTVGVESEVGAGSRFYFMLKKIEGTANDA